MSTISKFYLHQSGTAPSGAPADGTSISATTPTVIPLPGDAHHPMDGAAGASQTYTGQNSTATKSAQTEWYGRWYSAKIAAQTIAAQTISIHIAVQEGNTNQNLFLSRGCLAIYRLGTGVVARLFDTASLTSASFTTETAVNGSVTSSAGTANDQDILVYEGWFMMTQGKASAYFPQAYFDGTTEDSATDNAAYVGFTTAVSMYSAGGGAVDEEFPFAGGGYYPFEVLRRIEENVRRRFWRPGWARRPSGLVVPA